jgi:hypothetical protein
LCNKQAHIAPTNCRGISSRTYETTTKINSLTNTRNEREKKRC